MALKKSNKIHKITYQERVLGVLNQSQKSRQRRRIHMATLRAQIKKNAEANHDQMGPQWTRHISKAVKKLEGEGVVETCDQTVFLTPRGKETISTAARSVRYISDPQERIIKQAASIAKGLKRRLSTTTTGTDGVTSISAAPAPKRPRRSNIVPNPSKGIRAVGSIRTRTTAANTTTGTTPTRGRPCKSTTFATPSFLVQRDVSPLTDADDSDGMYAEENANLRARLRDKDDELLGLRRHLDEIVSGRHAAAALRDGQAEDEQQLPQVDVAPMTTIPAPSLEGETTGRTQAQHLVAKGLTRTQSGSIIPNISKQPTPAPSEGDQTEEGEEAPAGTTLTLGIDPLEHAKVDSQKAKETLIDRIKSLIHNIAQRDAIIKRIRADLEVSREKEGNLKTELSNQAEVVADMHETLTAFRTANDAHMKELDDERTKSQQNETELEATRNELEQSKSKVAVLETTSRSYSATMSELDESLSLAHAQLEGARERYTDMEMSYRGKDEELKLLQARLVSLNNDLEKLRSQSVNHEETLDRVTLELREEIRRRSRVEEVVATKEQELLQVRQEMATSQSALGQLEIDYEGAMEKLAEREHSLVVEKTRHQEEEQQLKEKGTDLEATVKGLRAEVEAAQRRATETDLEREKLRRANIGLGDEVTRFRMELEAEKLNSRNLAFDLATQAATTHNYEEEVTRIKAAKEMGERAIRAQQTAFENLLRIELKALKECGNSIGVNTTMVPTSVSSSASDLPEQSA